MRHSLWLMLSTLLLGCTAHRIRAPISYRPLAKRSANDDCEPLHKEFGRYSIVIIQRCRAAARKPSVIAITVIVLDVSRGGRLAAGESAVVILRYLGYRPSLSLVIMGRLSRYPMYHFVVTGRQKMGSSP